MNDDERFLIEVKEEKDFVSKVNRNPFPVALQLMIALLILGAIFAGIIIPKTVSFFNNDQDNLVVPEVYIVEKELDDEPVPQKIEGVDIKAKSAFVWDVKEQRVLYQKNAEEKLPLASITKLMTALVAYELVPEDTEVVVTNAASRQESGGNLREGEVFKVKSLADFALVSSYNSAAYAVADSVGSKLGEQDSVSQFVAGMNIRAEELGLDSLEFYNPTGLDISEEKAGAYGTAKDVSFLVEYILENHPTIINSTILDTTRIYNESGEYHDAHNTNNIIKQIPNLLGSKTGYTDLAGGNLTVAVDIGFNHPVVITVLGSTISERFSDVDILIKAVQDTVIVDNE